MKITAQTKSASEQLSAIYGEPTRYVEVSVGAEVVYNHDMSKSYPTKTTKVGVWEVGKRLARSDEITTLQENGWPVMPANRYNLEQVTEE